MGGGHPGLAAIAAWSEVSPINRRIVLTARAFCRSRILEHARPDRGLCTAARFSSFATALPPQSITRSQPARVSPPGKRRLPGRKEPDNASDRFPLVVAELSSIREGVPASKPFEVHSLPFIKWKVVISGVET